MKTLASLLLFLAISASAQVREVPIAPPQYGPAEGSQNYPRAATNGTDFLVAWSDARAGESVFATRVTREGTVLDRTGIPVALSPLGVSVPELVSVPKLVAVLWCGDAYVIVMAGQDSSAHWFTFVARIDVNGKVIDGPRIVVPGYSTAAATN